MPLIVEIDAGDIDLYAEGLNRTQKEIDRAVRRAASRAARWARVQVARGLAARLGVPEDVMAGKRISAKSGRSGSKVWIALNPLNAARVSLTPTRRGLRAGNTNFRGAFLMRGKGDMVAVRRKGSTRLPLEAASFNVLSLAEPEINNKVWPALNEKFLDFYQEEIQRMR